MIYKLIFALLIGALVMMSCSNYGTNSEDDPNVTVEATFSSIQANVFNKSCALSGCHDSGSQQSGLDLSSGKAYGNLVNVPSVQKSNILRVKPNDATNSYLIMKLEGASGIAGKKMPLNGSLSQDKIDAIKEWINNGAKNN